MNALRKALFSSLFTALLAGAATAAPYPSKPIRLVVPYPPGGPTDVVGRLVAKGIHDRLGQPVIVENKPGAASNLGAAHVASSKPDGYTLLLGTSVTFAINPNLYKDLPYDVLTDFAPVAAVTLTPSILLANTSLPFNDLPGLLDYARHNPGKLRYGSFGFGSVGHLNGAQLVARGKVDIQHIPYKGSAQAMTDLIGGHIDIVFDPIMTALPNIKSHKVKALAITSSERSPVVPDMPTLAEQGLPGYEYAGWYGIVAAGGTPPDILDALNGAINDSLQDPETRTILLTGGTSPAPMSRQAFGTLIKATFDRSKEMIQNYGLTTN